LPKSASSLPLCISGCRYYDWKIAYLWSTYGFLCTFAPSPPPPPLPIASHSFLLLSWSCFIYPCASLFIFPNYYLPYCVVLFVSPAITRADKLGTALSSSSVFSPAWQLLVESTSGLIHENEITFVVNTSSREYQYTTDRSPLYRRPNRRWDGMGWEFVRSHCSRSGYATRQMKVGYPDRA
jgi:hypothetical protein